MISTRNLSDLPDISELKSLSQSLALLDAILCPEWDLRCFSFNSLWAAGEAMASMRDGSGNGYFLLFSLAGAIMKGFDHEAPMTPHRVNPPEIWPDVLDSVPEVFASFLSEPAFSLEDTTFCLWRSHAEASWQRGNIAFPHGDDPDGSAQLLALLDGNPLTYQAWAEEYYNQTVDLASIESIYAHTSLTENVVKSLNPEMTLPLLQDDVVGIGYP